jgi:hypothetical protein
MSMSDMNFRVDSRTVARKFDATFTRFANLFMRRARSFDIDRMCSGMQEQYNSSLAVNTTFSGALEKGMQREEQRYEAYSQPRRYDDRRDRGSFAQRDQYYPRERRNEERTSQFRDRDSSSNSYQSRTRMTREPSRRRYDFKYDEDDDDFLDQSKARYERKKM